MRTLASPRFWVSLAANAAVAFAVGSAGCQIRVHASRAKSGIPKVELAGQAGVQSVTATYPNPCEIDLDFGDVAIGQTESATVKVANAGTWPLDLSQVNPTLDPEFGLRYGAQAPISPGGFGSFPVTFQPYREAPVASSFVVDTDGFNESCPNPSQVTVSLAGVGVQLSLALEPGLLDFGNTLLGTTSQGSVTLVNHSSKPLAGITTTVGGGDASLFSISDAPTSLAENAQATLHVTFAPQETETRSVAKVVFATPEGATTTLTLLGTPVGAALVVAPDPIDFGYVPERTNALGCTVVTNQANVPVSIGGVTAFASHSAAFATSAFDDGSPANPILFPLALAPSASAKVCFTFLPKLPQLYEESATLTADALGGGNLSIGMAGWGGGPQITCTPTALDFGETLDNSTSSLPVICTNTGTATSGATLTFAPPRASPSVFTAEFDPTQNPYPLPGLDPGQSVQIDVRYRPAMPTADKGALFISGNGGQGKTLEIPLAGKGLDVPPCQFVLSPSALDFANVSAGETSPVLSFEIQNVGPNICQVKDLAIQNDPTGSFHILSTSIQPDPNTGRITIPGHTPGQASSLMVSLDFAPASASQAFSAEAAFTITDPRAPNQVVPLAGTSEPSCLVVAPTSLNFGDVGANDSGLLCTSANRTFSIYNACQSAASVQSIVVQSGPGDSVVQFSSPVGPSPLPLNLPAGAAAQVFEMSFQPSTLGQHSGQLLISDGTIETLLPLQGAAVSTGTETDTFLIGPPKADLLWIMDVDDDGSEQGVIAGQLPTFVAAAGDIDYRMAITTDNDGPTSAFAEFGRLVPCLNCSMEGPAPTIVSPSSIPAGGTQVDPGTAFVQLWSGVKANNAYGADEHFFLGLYNALQHAPQPGVDFFRPGAFFAAITDNGDDEPDHSEAGAGTHDPSWYSNYFETYFQNPYLFAWNYINPTQIITGTGFSNYLQLPPSIQQMISATNGLAINSTDPNWPTTLSSLWAQARTAHTYYPLVGSPSPGQTGISVSVNGKDLPSSAGPGATNWIYQATLNAIVFNPNGLPGNGTTVSVTYPIGCH